MYIVLVTGIKYTKKIPVLTVVQCTLVHMYNNQDIADIYTLHKRVWTCLITVLLCIIIMISCITACSCKICGIVKVLLRKVQMQNYYTLIIIAYTYVFIVNYNEARTTSHQALSFLLLLLHLLMQYFVLLEPKCFGAA